MKADDDKIMLNITYSFLDPSKDKSTQKTEEGHFFVAGSKKELEAKIKAFEASFKSQKRTSFFQRTKAYIKQLIESSRYTQRDMRRI